MNQALEQAEQAANRMRAEFVRTLEELDRRKEEATDLKLQAKRNWPVLAGVGAAVAGIVFARVLLEPVVEHRIAVKRRAQRKRALLRAWEHPERVAPPRHDAAVTWSTRATTLAGLVVAAALGRTLVKRILG